MLFLNSIELTVHEINVHVDNWYQCQSCYKILRNTDEFNEHFQTICEEFFASMYLYSFLELF